MASPIYYLKQFYSSTTSQNSMYNFNDYPVFEQDAYQRIGKQFLSILVSTTMIKSKTQATNKNISNALKKFEQDLFIKMKLNSKKQLYAIFGRYTFCQLQNFSGMSVLEIELAQMFFRRLKFFSDQNQSLSMFSSLPYQKLSTLTSTEISSSCSQSTTDTYTRQPVYSKAYGNLEQLVYNVENHRKPVYNVTYKNHMQRLPIILEQQTKRSNLTNFMDKKFQTPDQAMTDEERSQRGDNDNQESFNFDLTQKDVPLDDRDLCEQFFINLVAYLKNLSSPQGQLTYIWQHLKWQGFETIYEPYLNQMHEWVCTGRIFFPASMSTPQKKFLHRTKASKNKKKARQLACMDLLKSLYLQYPQVWLMYKHLKGQKKLTIAPLEQAKDDDELAIITNRNNYYIDKQKIYKLFNTNKTNIELMMEKISAKAQMNNLLQQLPGRVTSPKISKKIVDGLWSVPVRIQYRTEDHIENNIPPKVYQKTVICQNARIAQQQAYMLAIIELYQNNPQLFQKIQSIKLAKNIKDAQKKLPLMRNLTSDSDSSTHPYNIPVLVI